MRDAIYCWLWILHKLIGRLNDWQCIDWTTDVRTHTHSISCQSDVVSCCCTLQQQQKNVHHNLMKSQWKKLIAYIYTNPDGVMYGGRFELHAHSRDISWIQLVCHCLTQALRSAVSSSAHETISSDDCELVQSVCTWFCVCIYLLFQFKMTNKLFHIISMSDLWLFAHKFLLRFSVVMKRLFMLLLLLFSSSSSFFPPSLFMYTLCLAPNFTRHFQHSAAANKITWMKIT